MSHLYNKIAQKPVKKNQEQLSMPYSQTWMNNGKSDKFSTTQSMERIFFSCFFSFLLYFNVAFVMLMHSICVMCAKINLVICLYVSNISITLTIVLYFLFE